MKHIFKKEEDAENLALDIAAFLRKWGMWKDTQIFAGSKCYTYDENGGLIIRDEEHPEEYMGIYNTVSDCNGKKVCKYIEYSNPERLLDMTFEGPLYSLFNEFEYRITIGDLSEEGKNIIVPQMDRVQDDAYECMEEFLENQWDPMEDDSYEEWLERTQYEYCDLVDDLTEDIQKVSTLSTREYEYFLNIKSLSREEKLLEYFEEDVCNNINYDDETFHSYTTSDGHEIADRVWREFDEIFERYGLWYEFGYCWNLSAYRA